MTLFDRMHKHAVNDYIDMSSVVILMNDLDQPKIDEIEFDKIFKKNFFKMF